MSNMVLRDASASKKVNYWLTDNLKSRDASASKNMVTLAFTNKAGGPGPHNCLLRLGNFRLKKEEEE